jgi:hypothetical protein
MDIRKIYNFLTPGKSWRSVWQNILEKSTDPEEIRAAHQYFAMAGGPSPSTPEITETFENEGASFRVKFKPMEKELFAKDRVLKEIREKKVAPAAEPAPTARVTEFPVNVAELQASIVNLRAELADVRGQLTNKTQSLERLERSLGVAAAQTVPFIPTAGETQSPIDRFNAMPEGPEKSRFYQEHEASIRPFIFKPVQA